MLSYPKQSTVSKLLHHEAWSALDEQRDNGREQLEELWLESRKELRSAIADAYVHASHLDGRWSLPAYRRLGVESYLAQNIHTILTKFHNLAQRKLAESMQQAKNHSAKRYAYILNQLTPESKKIRMPDYAHTREAKVFNIIPDTIWQDRWGQWVASYEQSLRNNLSMGAMNNSSLSDAMDEVDATKVNTPSSTIDDALSRLHEYMSERSIAEGEDDVASMNDELMDKEIWKTRGGACDDCLDNEGLTVEEASGDIPLHPFCRCRWIVVPISYADLLRSGNSDDQALADEMDRRGIVPEGIIVKGDDGNIIGRALISFSEWSQGQQRGVIG